MGGGAGWPLSVRVLLRKNRFMASVRVALTLLLTLVPCRLVAADLALLTVLERIGPEAARNDTCAKGEGQQVSYSRVTVFETHEVTYEYSDFRYCFGQRFIPPVHMRWDSPDTSQKLVFRKLLPDSKFHELRAFLDQPEVKTVQSFLNAAPIWHEFEYFDRPN
jgi:hypothetical protein